VDALLKDASAWDFLFVGDYYGRRGSIVARALEAGKHVLVDKPVCTSLAEYRRIEALARRGRLAVGCQLSLRDAAPARTLRRLVREGQIGRVLTITFSGQHPLRYGERPSWYFEPGKHGGTINDIAIHGIDYVRWATGSEVAEVVSARVWNDVLREVPHFEMCAQMMLRMESGCGVLADVSYTAVNEAGFGVPQYWRFTVHGEKGVAETWLSAPGVSLWRAGRTEVETVPLDPARVGGYLQDFLDDARGASGKPELDTRQVLESTRVALLAQTAARRSRGHVRVQVGPRTP
jgi:predicted dehydrogenase